MKAQISPSPPFSTAGLGPCELSWCSYSTGGVYQHWIFWSKCNDVHCAKPHLCATANSAMIKNKILCFLRLLGETHIWGGLIQFWGLVEIGEKMYLTTREQPFALRYLGSAQVKQQCEYRKHCLADLIPVDDDQISLAPPGRVFRSGLPEYAPNVRYYTSREYPQRDYAVDHEIGYWAFPVYLPTEHLPSGVLEIVSSFDIAVPRKKFLAKLQELNLATTGLSLKEVSSCQDRELDKIAEVFAIVRRRHKLPNTQFWTTSGEILSSCGGVYIIQKGQGVVGKAFSSKSACFCRDIRQLSITEYPLVPSARWLGYSGCFAVYLESSCSSNCTYILEFFLPKNEKDCEDPWTFLHMLMETLKQHLQSSFKIASGQGLGQELSVEVIKAYSDDQFDSFEICSTMASGYTRNLAEIHGGRETMQLDFSSQEVGAANGPINNMHEQENGSVGSTSRLAEVQEDDGMMQIDSSPQQVDAGNCSVNGIPGHQNQFVGSSPRPENLQCFVNISHQELMALEFDALDLSGVDTGNNSTNGTYEQQNEQSGIVRSSAGLELVQNIVSIVHEEPIAEMNVVDPERNGANIQKLGNEMTNIKKQNSSYTLKSTLGITREVLEQNSMRNLDDAAEVLGVSRSTLKRICREYGIHRWPPRKVREVNQAFVEQKVVQPSTEDIEEHHRSDATRLEDDSSVWVNAEYQEYKIKLRLPFSTRKIDLDEKIAQRFNLSIGSFKIEYQDEDNEWFLIACDEDLSISMSTLSSLGRTAIKMRVN